MIEIRPITQSETGDFLRLLCQVFDLDYQRASAVFFSEPFYDLTHKWALFDAGYMLSCLTTTPLMFGHGAAIGIAGVATTPDARRRGLAKRLVSDVLDRLALPAILFAKDMRLYEAIGFQSIDSVVRSKLVLHEPVANEPELGSDRITEIYNSWAREDGTRLIRDDRRWRFWNWHYRTCYRLGDHGYIAVEPGVLREAIPAGAFSSLPSQEQIEWLGLKSMVELLELPTTDESIDMHVMSRGLSFRPQMFLTDQF